MKEDVGLILFNTVNYYLNKVITKTLVKVKYRHGKKLVSLRQHKKKALWRKYIMFIRSTVHNYSYYNLSIVEEERYRLG